MNLVKKFILAMVALFVFDGCGGNTSMVKNSFLEGYESLTIGEAFDNYKYFKSTEWTEFTADNGTKVVQVDCVGDYDEFKKQADIEAGNDKAMKMMVGLADLGFYRKVVVQFTINHDDSFEVSNVQATTKLGTMNLNEQEITKFFDSLYSIN